MHTYTQTHTPHLLGLPSLGANHLYSFLTTGTGWGGIVRHLPGGELVVLRGFKVWGLGLRA